MFPSTKEIVENLLQLALEGKEFISGSDLTLDPLPIFARYVSRVLLTNNMDQIRELQRLMQRQLDLAKPVSSERARCWIAALLEVVGTYYIELLEEEQAASQAKDIGKHFYLNQIMIALKGGNKTYAELEKELGNYPHRQSPRLLKVGLNSLSEASMVMFGEPEELCVLTPFGKRIAEKLKKYG